MINSNQLPNNNSKILQTKFGLLECTSENTYFFGDGIFDVGKGRFFTLAHFPLEHMWYQFMVLQSVDNNDLGFLLLNTIISDEKNPLQFIEYDDIKDDLDIMKINLAEVSIHLAVNIKNIDDEKKVQINRHQPILLNPKTMQGWQINLRNPTYQQDCFL